MTRGVSRGRVIPPPPQNNQDHMVSMANQKTLPVPGTEKINRTGLPPKEPALPASHSAYQARNKPVVQNAKAGIAPTGAGDDNFTGQWQSFENTSSGSLRIATSSRANPVTSFNFGMASSLAPDVLHTSVPVCTPWNAVPYGHQPNASFSAHSYPNTTLTASTASNIEQYNANSAWRGTAQADYLAYYNNYPQNVGVSDTNTMPASHPGSNFALPPPPPPPPATQSEAVAYTSYYSAFYGGATGFADPSVSPLSYMYPYNGNQPT